MLVSYKDLNNNEILNGSITVERVMRREHAHIISYWGRYGVEIQYKVKLLKTQYRGKAIFKLNKNR